MRVRTLSPGAQGLSLFQVQISGENQMSASTELVASLPFLGYKQRNLVLDNFFYDTASITLAERANFTPLVDREGSIVVVPPSNSDRKIRHYKCPDRKSVV